MSEALKLHLAQAENRIRYSLEFATEQPDEESRIKSLAASLKASEASLEKREEERLDECTVSMTSTVCPITTLPLDRA